MSHRAVVRTAFAVLCALVAVASDVSAAIGPASSVTLTPRLAAVVVHDFEQSKSWYAAALEFTVVSERAFPDRGLRICIMRSGDFELEIVEDKKAVRSENPARFAKLAFSVGDLEGLGDRLVSQKANIQGGIKVGSRTGLRQLLVRDPEGNLLQFFEMQRTR